MFQHAESTRHHCNKNTQPQSHFISGFAMSLTRLTPFLLNWPGLLKFSTCRCHVLQVLAWKLLREALARFLPQDLVSSAPAAAGPGMKILLKVVCNSLRKILWRSSWNAVRGLCVIWHRSLWEALEDAPVKSSMCPYMIWYRSLRQDLVEILLQSSSRASRGPCIKILKMLCVGACMNILLGCS